MKPDDAEKLIRILRLLGSDQVGERAAAALAAHRFVETLGLSWTDIVNASAAPRRPSRVVVRRTHEYGLDPAGAADARMRQLKSTNERLEHQNRVLRRRVTTLAERERRRRQGEDS